MRETVQAFLNRYFGRPLDFDKSFGNQCFDVLQQYNKEVFGGGFIAGATAIEVFNNNTYSQNLYTKVLNTPTNIPKTGDIIFFKYNHVAIVVLADLYSLTVFEQNYPAQGYYDAQKNFIGTGVCKLGIHSYDNVAGWLTPKV